MSSKTSAVRLQDSCLLMVVIVSNTCPQANFLRKMDMTERDTQLAKLASKLHSTRQFSPMQMRQQAGFLDSNDQQSIPLETILSWLDRAQAAAPTPSQSVPAWPRQADDTSALHAKMALRLMEAQLRHLSFQASRTPSPGGSPRYPPRAFDTVQIGLPTCRRQQGGNRRA